MNGRSFFVGAVCILYIQASEASFRVWTEGDGGGRGRAWATTGRTHSPEMRYCVLCLSLFIREDVAWMTFSITILTFYNMWTRPT